MSTQPISTSLELYAELCNKRLIEPNHMQAIYSLIDRFGDYSYVAQRHIIDIFERVDSDVLDDMDIVMSMFQPFLKKSPEYE